MGKIFLTANDKRNRFRCLMPIFNEQMDEYLDMSIADDSLDQEVIGVISEMRSRLKELFGDAAYAHNFNLDEDSTFRDLIRCLKSFKEVPIAIATPGDLTYINFRMEKLIGLFN